MLELKRTHRRREAFSAPPFDSRPADLGVIALAGEHLQFRGGVVGTLVGEGPGAFSRHDHFEQSKEQREGMSMQQHSRQTGDKGKL